MHMRVNDRLNDDPCVHDGAGVRTGDHRIEVQFGDLRVSEADLRDPCDQRRELRAIWRVTLPQIRPAL